MNLRLKRARELAGYAVQLTKDEGLPTMLKRGAGFVKRRCFGKKARYLPAKKVLEAQRAEMAGKTAADCGLPTISVLTPLYNTPEKYLREFLDSFVNQTAPNGQLCLADASDAEHADVKRIVEEYQTKNQRIVYKKSENKGIAANTNAAAELATGEYLALATEKLHDAPIYMDDTSGITITEMKAKIRRVNQDPTRPNVGLIVIDYLQLMSTGQRTENRVQEISSITRNLKIMAKEMNVPIIALSQLSRAVEKQGNNSSHRPQLSDLRDSGSIEQDADCVLFLYRDSYYASQNPDGAEVDADTAECIVAKNRHGETSTVPLGWDGAHTRFMDVDFKR